jgi:hypothetical protein
MYNNMYPVIPSAFRTTGTVRTRASGPDIRRTQAAHNDLMSTLTMTFPIPQAEPKKAISKLHPHTSFPSFALSPSSFALFPSSFAFIPSSFSPSGI